MLVVAKIFFQPFDGLQIKVIGRLIKQQIVGVAKQGLSQHYAYFLFSAQFAHQHLVFVIFNAQLFQQCGGIAFSIVTTHVGKLFFQLGNLHTVFFAEVGLCIESFAFFGNVPQFLVSHQYGVKHLILVKFKVVLAQYTQTFARAYFNVALACFQFARYRAEQGAFSCSVGTDNAVDVSVGEL